MSEDTELEEGITQDAEDATTDGATDDTTHGSEVSKETLEVQKRKALQQRDEWKRKAEEALAKLDSTKGSVETPKEIKKASPETNLEQERRLMAVEFTLANPQLSKEAIKEVMDYAITKNISPEKALESPVIKYFVEAEINKKKVEMATPQGSRSGREKPPIELSGSTREEHKDYVMKRIEEELKG